MASVLWSNIKRFRVLDPSIPPPLLHFVGALNEVLTFKSVFMWMRRALDSSDVELLKLIDTEEGFYLDESLPLHYAVDSCIREVVKALLELGAVDVNYPAGATGFNIRTVGGIITPLDILRTLTSDFLFKGAVPGLTHIEPNKLRLCLELVQSARMVISREEGNNSNNNNNDHNNPIHPQMNEEHNRGSNEN